jgi:maltokinase
LHVGQVLRSADRLWIIDLDDDISLPPTERGRPLPPARDIAQLLNSFDHVGRMVDDRSAHARPDQVAAWVAAARSSLLGGYRDALAAAGRAELFDERMLVPFEAERVCRELLYAARILPRWMYAPLSTLHRMFDA